VTKPTKHDGVEDGTATGDESPEVRPGQPRSPSDAAFLERFDARMRIPIIVSAVLPLIVIPEAGNWLGEAVGVLTWLVFLVDYRTQARHIDRYRHTRIGRFDLTVVVLTAPWFLLPGAHAGSFVVLLRLARLGRLILASRAARELFRRLGRVAIIAVGVVVIASFVAYHAEHPSNPQFATVGDSLWWGIVTLTTVGYGDIVPVTTTGRWAGITIMITGVSVLGLLAGSLASFFRLDSTPDEGGPAPLDAATEPATESSTEPASGPASGPAWAPPPGDWGALVTEIAALRQQVESLSTRLTGETETR
jgi:voltage-gated potassium channel